MRTRTVLACAFVLALLVPTGVAGVEGRADLSATLPDDRVVPGEATELHVQIMNTGTVEESGSSPQTDSLVTTARGVRAEMKSGGAPITVETGRASLGSIPDGAVAELDVAISVDDDAEPGTYRVPVEVRYQYTEEIDEQNGDRDDRTIRDTVYVTLRIEDAPRFEIVDADTDAQVGDGGDVSLTLENVGSETARDARVTVQSRSSEFVVGANGSESRYVGAWNPGERRTVDVPATVRSTAGAGERTYAIVALVDYADGTNAALQSDPLVTGVVPSPEQRFEFESDSSTLRVGERGVVTGSIVNAGPETARAVVVRLRTSDDALVPIRTEYAVGSLGPEESTTVEFPVRVADAGEAGPYQFDASVTYQNGDGDVRESGPLSVRATVEPERDRFALEPQNATFAPDSSNRLVVRVTNTGDAARTDVGVALAPTPPFTSVAPEAYAGQLEPGESRLVAFELSVDEDAVESTHGLRANVTSESADDTRPAVESHRVSVTVAEESTSVDAAPIVAVVVLGLAIVGGVGFWWYRQR